VPVIDPVSIREHLRQACVRPLPSLVEDVVSAYLELVHLEAPGLIQGLYLVGSVALDDFRPRTSDIDFVAVTGPRPDAAALIALSRVHVRLQARWPRPFFDGLYVTWDDLALDPSHVGPRPHSHEGQFDADSSSTPDPVTWHTLTRYGAACLGPSPSDLDIWAHQLGLATWTVGNLEIYWRRWRARASRLLSPFGVFSLSPYATVWGVTGVSRLHYTLATGDICSKDAAGRYALAAFPEQWHRVVQEALRIRRVDRAGPSIGSGIAAQGHELMGLWRVDQDRSLFWSPLGRRRDLLAFVDMAIAASDRLYKERIASREQSGK
jgi:hypothetical protein